MHVEQSLHSSSQGAGNWDSQDVLLEVPPSAKMVLTYIHLFVLLFKGVGAACGDLDRYYQCLAYQGEVARCT